MRAFRARSTFITSIVLAWQLVAVMYVPAALSCEDGAAASQSASHAMMIDCPMVHGESVSEEPSCPYHNDGKGSHQCDCPTLGCSQTDRGLMTLFGLVGVLPPLSIISTSHAATKAAAAIIPSTASLAPVPLAPPPRA